MENLASNNVNRGEGGAHARAMHLKGKNEESADHTQLPWWKIGLTRHSAPEPRIIHSQLIDFADIIEKSNKAIGNTNVHFTINNNIIQKNTALLQELCNPVLNNHKVQLAKWIKTAEKAYSDEAKEAIYALAGSASSALIDQAINRKLGPARDRAHTLILFKPELLQKFKNMFENKCLDAIKRTGETPAMRKLLKAYGDRLEDRCRLWLEAQGVRHWSAATQSSSVETTKEPVFYVTESDLRAQQLKVLGYEWCTPDFLFVDAQGLPVRVPVSFHKVQPGTATTALKSPPTFLASVLEVKGHFVVQGLTNEADESKIFDQLNRYSDAFGPPLMLQKHGITEATARAMTSKFRSSRRPRHLAPGVITVDLKRLPVSKLPNPWARAVPDNYTRDWNYFAIYKPHHRPPNSQFPNKSQGEVLQAWMRVSPEAASAAFMDRLLLKKLRAEASDYLAKHLVDGRSHGADKHLFQGWEGRLFSNNLAKGRAAVESARASAKLKAKAIKAAESKARALIESEGDFENWEDREDANDEA